MTYNNKVLIMIPAYKRHETLRLSLLSLCQNTERDLFGVDIVVGINAPVENNRSVVRDVAEKYGQGLNVRWQEYQRNIGKAEALNTIYETCFDNHRYVISMDSDIVIKKP